MYKNIQAQLHTAHAQYVRVQITCITTINAGASQESADTASVTTNSKSLHVGL